jgi:hypothetical protein
MRKALLSRLAGNHCPATSAMQGVVLEELGIERGLSRIDVAVVGDGLTGFELKSDFDVADRLSTQIHAFNRVFDRIHLVVSANAAPEYLAIVPRWWGVWVAVRTEQDPSAISISELRAASTNPVREALSIVSLLRGDEVLALTARYAERAIGTCSVALPKSRPTKGELGRYLTELLTLEELALAVATTLRERFLCPAAFS